MIIKSSKIIIAYIHDICAVFFAWLLAYILRFNLNIPEYYFSQIWQVLPYIIIPQSIFFIYIGLYKGLWRFASLPDLKRIVIASLFAFLLILAISIYINIPRSIILLFPILLVLSLGANRFIYRFYKEGNFFKNKLGEPILVIGAGKEGKTVSKELLLNRKFNIIGFLDNDISLHGRYINNIKILGGINLLKEHVDRFLIKEIILTIPLTRNDERRDVLLRATKLNLRVLITPSVDELVSGRLTISRLRNVDVVDILGRDLINLSESKIKQDIHNSTILLTGAGGSIGSELCRQIIQFKPKTIVCLDISEFALYKLEESLSKKK